MSDRIPGIGGREGSQNQRARPPFGVWTEIEIFPWGFLELRVAPLAL